ncbi:MAG TPA: amidase [Vicinamibacterales bacterium]|nr:amidase [Vicinamibacterales bacterium]
MKNEPHASSTIGDLSQRLRAHDVSAVDIVDACLARIDALNPRLNAFITVLADGARERAQEADRDIRAGNWRGPLHGVPVGIKDFYDTAGVRTTAAFERFKDRVPKQDAFAVTALQDAGAIVIGKTNMHRLGMGTTGLESAFGPAHNPWNDAYVPGGSSSGSSVAVAAGLCYATLDTDAIGSCRLPAACCGNTGFKGTYGAISSKGILDGEPVDQTILWYAHPGLTTRSAADTAILLEALLQPDVRAKMPASRDPNAAVPRLRIGVVENVNPAADVDRAFRSAVETLRNLGHQIGSAKAPFDMPPMGNLQSIEADRAAISNRAFKDVDMLVLPTLPTAVLPVDRARGNEQALSPAHTMFANYFGIPAISVPCGVDAQGLPIGLQIVGGPWDDSTILRLAAEYQAATDWHDRRPIA